MSADGPRPGINRRIGHRAFRLLQRAGLDVLPRHFYSQIPDLRRLRRERDWRRPRGMTGIAGAGLEGQLEFARSCCDPELVDSVESTGLYAEACELNGAVGYGPIEAEFLYCFAATRRPLRVIQVGAGVSTIVLMRAAEERGFETRITCIDPFPTDHLRDLAAAGRIDLVAEPAESLPLKRLAELEPGSLLFVDSTHAVRPGSEVNRIVLDVLPELQPGVYVHFHDIVFPYDYAPRVLDEDLFFWSESALLQAFLTDNRRVELRLALSMIHHGASEELARIIPSYRPAPTEDGVAIGPLGADAHFPSSAFLEVVA